MTQITLAHGEGARLTRELIQKIIQPAFEMPNVLHDATVVETESNRIAMTTDSYVVSPRFFSGGNIGSLAVYGTVNDLAVAGAKPKWLSVAFVIEEGFELSELETIVDSIATAAERCGIRVICGDTKVVPHGAADGLFINTTGIGEVIQSDLSPEQLREGDAIIVSGPIGRHGLAIMAARDELSFETPPTSDSAPLHDAVAAVLNTAGSCVRCLRDVTRGGVSAVLHEWTEACDLSIELQESEIPIDDEVSGACELLGIDPLYLANEGTMLLGVHAAAVDQALSALASVVETPQPALIGRVRAKRISPVYVKTALDSERPVDEPSGVILPRIC